MLVLMGVVVVVVAVLTPIVAGLPFLHAVVKILKNPVRVMPALVLDSSSHLAESRAHLNR